ncbi:hypothetical protein, partial [Leptolyngbya sp. FACHB-16]|uniref:hypothetical protein n=1 Tax=unclassified Leptolyngbya TaxID=2650499 RepID=UPI001A7EEDA8
LILRARSARKIKGFRKTVRTNEISEKVSVTGFLFAKCPLSGYPSKEHGVRMILISERTRRDGYSDRIGRSGYEFV